MPLHGKHKGVAYLWAEVSTVITTNPRVGISADPVKFSQQPKCVGNSLTGRERSGDMPFYNWVCFLVKTDSGSMSFSWTVHWIHILRNNVIYSGNHQDHHCHRQSWQQNPASESSSRFWDRISGRQHHLHYRCEIVSCVIKLALPGLERKGRKKSYQVPLLIFKVLPQELP